MSAARLTILKHRPGGMELARESLAKAATCQKCKVLLEVDEKELMKCPRCGYVHAFQFSLKWDAERQQYT